MHGLIHQSISGSPNYWTGMFLQILLAVSDPDGALAVSNPPDSEIISCSGFRQGSEPACVRADKETLSLGLQGPGCAGVQGQGLCRV